MTQHPTPDLLPPGTRLPPDARIRATSHERNTAATVSLFCAVWWPASVLVYLLGPELFMLVTGSNLLPAFIALPMATGIFFAPCLGIVAGHIGLYRALKHPALRTSKWRALSGLGLGYVWLVALLLVTNLGVALVDGLTHLGRG